MRRLGLGEHGDVVYGTRKGRPLAMVYYRDFTGIRRRVKASGRSKAEARREVLNAVERALAQGRDGEFSARSTLAEGAEAWLAYFEGLVERGTRSPTTLDLYRLTVEKHIVPGVGALRLGEVSTARLDRFLQKMLRERGYATAKVARTVLSGICGWLVRQDGLPSNPVRDVSRLESDRDRTPRALTVAEVHEWLAMLDASADARHKDLPELARFILATGLRLGEALGVRWSDVDLDRGILSVERTVIRVRGQGLRASRLKSRTSYRVLVLPGWCVTMLKARRVRLGAFDGPVFPDARGGYRDRNNVGRAFREARAGTGFDWVKPHTYRKTVATILDSSGASARMIADQLGHSRISMTQDVYMGRRAVDPAAASALGDLAALPQTEDDQDT
ncbi:tyrosine recombinase XerC [Pedococcus sp. NPDC057267]|uniref:site-specific integrase n=1 Tax=Pedococcus sp. NPDC057267 TaxID=3346077 RepID=UPI003633A6AB